MARGERWTVAENNRLMRQVAAFPQNLQKCFIIVAEELERTPSAVATHWYTYVSKDPANLAFFTASQHHICKNRKNGEGEESNSSIWRRFLRIINSL